MIPQTDKVPEGPGGIRAMIIVSGYYVKALSKNTCSVTYVYSIDLKGWIPTSVVVCLRKVMSSSSGLTRPAQSRANLEQPLYLSDLRECCEKYVRANGTAWADA